MRILNYQLQPDNLRTTCFLKVYNGVNLAMYSYRRSRKRSGRECPTRTVPPSQAEAEYSMRVAHSHSLAPHACPVVYHAYS